MKLPNGFGSISKQGGKRRNKYRVRATIGWSEEGKQIYKELGYKPSYKEAMELLLLYHENPNLIDSKSITFKEVYKKWSESKYKGLSTSSIEGYLWAYGYCKELYDIPFADLRLVSLQNIINKADGKYSTQKKIKGFFSLLYDYAIANDIMNKNYANYLDLNKPVKKVVKIPFSEKEINILWNNVDKLEFVDTVLILIYTGMRIEELLSLKRENIFLNKNYMIGGLKTEAGINRIIPIHPKIKPLIENWYNNSTSEYLLYNAANNKIDYRNYHGRIWKEIMNTLNMNHTPHETRHTFASLMDDAGANKLCIKLIMGHRVNDITDGVYTHKTIESLHEAIRLIK